MKKVILTVVEGSCRSGYHKTGDTFVFSDICPPVCAELWHNAYPYVFALQNGAELDDGSGRSKEFTVKCPDGGRVVLRGKLSEE
jgi:uncharacterized repeat protein (TIGR04076 family)